MDPFLSPSRTREGAQTIEILSQKTPEIEHGCCVVAEGSHPMHDVGRLLNRFLYSEDLSCPCRCSQWRQVKYELAVADLKLLNEPDWGSQCWGREVYDRDVLRAHELRASFSTIVCVDSFPPSITSCGCGNRL